MRTLTIGLWIYITRTSFVVGGVGAVAVIVYPLIILLVGWLVGTRMAVAVAMATSVVTLAFAILESLHFLPPTPPTPPILRWIVHVLRVLPVGAADHPCGALLSATLADQRELGRVLAERTRDLEAREADLIRAQAVAHVGSWEYQLATDTMHLSAETCRIFGIPEATQGSHDTYLSRVHVEDRASLDEAWQSVLREGVRFEHEHRIVAGETIRWIRQIAELERDADGRPLRSVGTTEDITERRRAEDSLRESEAQLERILASTADGLLAVNQQGRVIQTNAAVCAAVAHSAVAPGSQG